jgi:hypothetical protein
MRLISTVLKVLLPATLVVACATQTPYAPPTEGPTATFRAIVGGGYGDLTVYDFVNGDNCTGLRQIASTIPHTQAPKFDGIVIAAEKPITLQFVSSGPYLYCQQKFSFIPRKGKRYIITSSMDQNAKTCNLNIKDVSDAEKPPLAVNVMGRKQGNVATNQGLEGCQSLSLSEQ